MKYFRTLLLALQSEFQSRLNFIGWFIVTLIPAITLCIVWLALLGGQADIGGYSRGDFIVYYLFMALSWYVIGGTFSGPLGTSIKNGVVNVTLLKPYDIVLDACIKEQAWKVISLILVIPTTIIILYLFGNIINISLTPFEIGLLIISLVVGGVMFAILEAIVGIGAFWVTEVWPLQGIKEFALSLFGARLIPFALMPEPIRIVSDFLPFKYIFYSPLGILLGKIEDPFREVVNQLIFMVILFVLYKILWRSGIKRYEATGG